MDVTFCEAEWGWCAYPYYRVPHNGVSLDGECMTYSIGFRAPSQRDLLMGMATYAQQHLLQDE